MGSCVSRRKPSVSKDNQPIINTPDKLDADNYRHHHHHHHHKPENSAVSTAISESERSFANSTPTDAKIAINFFPIDSFPNDTLNLLKGKCNLVELECKNEIKLYISATFTDSLFERNYLNTSNLFTSLRSYSANKSCDLDIIDLHWHLENIDLINKYLHRNLIKNLLNDILVNSNTIFLIFLNESFDKPLCPDRIEKVDYLKIHKLLNQTECELLDSWYVPIDSNASTCFYELRYFNNTNPNEHVTLSSRADGIKQLIKLMEIFQKTLTNDLAHLKQKYLKSLQEIEVELAVKHLNPSSIIWFERTTVSIDSGGSVQENSILKELQSIVFAHNYKNYKVDDAELSQKLIKDETYLTVLSEFINEACRKSIDFYIKQLKPYETYLKIDSTLSCELCKHWEIYNKLNKSSENVCYTNLNDYKSKLSDYANGNAFKAVVVYDQIDSTHYDNNILSILIANWINSHSKCFSYPIVYRFCGHTVFSNSLYSLIQSVMHQLCYLFEIHESYAFHDFQTLIEHLEKIFEYKFKQETSNYKLIIVLDRIDNITNVYESELSSSSDDVDKNKNNLLAKLFETFLRILNKHNKNLKLVITIANSKKNGKLLQLLKSTLDNHNDISFVALSGLKEDRCSPTHKASNNKNLKQKTTEIYSTLNEYFIETPHLVDCLFDYLINSRYGLKEVEILDLLYLSALSLIGVYKAKKLPIKSTNSKIIFNFTMYPITSEINMDYLRSLTSLVWYSFKYNFFLQQQQKLRLFENYVHNNQLYYCFYDLNIKRKFHQYLINNQNQANNCEELSIIDKRLLIYDYFNLNINETYIQKLNNCEVASISPLKTSKSISQQIRKTSYNVLNEIRLSVTVDDALTIKLNEIPYQRILLCPEELDRNGKNLVTYRMYQEVNLHYYNYFTAECNLNTSSVQQEQQNNKKISLSEQQLSFLEDYLTNFLINFDWFFNKINKTHIWFYVDDLEYFKHHLEHLSQFTETNLKFKQLNDEFYIFEKCFYKILYALNNDINQVYAQLSQALNLFDVSKQLNSKFLKLNSFFVNLKQHYEASLLFYPILKPSSGGDENNNTNANENIFAFNEMISSFDENKCILSFVSFVKNLESYAVTFSKTKNEVKIWNVKTLKIVRSIKLNLPPKDIRFIDSYKCVMLVDRKLHIFDLNKCEHLYDLKTTMKEDMPYFDLQNETTLVFLNRNRLSVTMTQLPSKCDDNNVKQEENTQECTVTQQQKVVNKSKHQNQFKVGEDRYIKSLNVSKNGKVLVCGDETQKPFPLIVWNLFEQKLIWDFRQANHEFLTDILSVSTNGKYLICACKEISDSRVFLSSYDLTTGRSYKKFETNSNYIGVEISEEYNAIVASLENNKILIYDISSENEKYILQDSMYPVNKIKITQYNRFLTYDTRGYDWTVRLWDIKFGVLLCSYTCPSKILCCDINSNGDTISLGLYNYSRLYVLKVFKNLNDVLKVQEDEFSCEVDKETPTYGDLDLVGRHFNIFV